MIMSKKDFYVSTMNWGDSWSVLVIQKNIKGVRGPRKEVMLQAHCFLSKEEAAHYGNQFLEQEFNRRSSISPMDCSFRRNN